VTLHWTLGRGICSHDVCMWLKHSIFPYWLIEYWLREVLPVRNASNLEWMPLKYKMFQLSLVASKNSSLLIGCFSLKVLVFLSLGSVHSRSFFKYWRMEHVSFRCCYLMVKIAKKYKVFNPRIANVESLCRI